MNWLVDGMTQAQTRVNRIEACWSSVIVCQKYPSKRKIFPAPPVKNTFEEESYFQHRLGLALCSHKTLSRTKEERGAYYDLTP